jgi:ribosomal protein S18 acetylase RimI-like enzyme
MPELSLLSKIRGRRTYDIRPATTRDWAAIRRLCDRAYRSYLALEWWTTEEWLDTPHLLLADDPQRGLAGLLLAVGGQSPVAWLNAVVINADDCLDPLLEASARTVRALGSRELAFLGGEGWLLSRLRHNGFEKANRVITLQFAGAPDPPSAPGPAGLVVQTATAEHLEKILQVDRAAFPPLWWYGPLILTRALKLARCFDVAYLDGQCVGYQFSTLQERRGHIVRLATHPDWQRRGIAGRLLGEALAALGQGGARTITVNTQENNHASLQLYRRFNFELTSQAWNVWHRPT